MQLNRAANAQKVIKGPSTNRVANMSILNPEEKVRGDLQKQKIPIHHRRARHKSKMNEKSSAQADLYEYYGDEHSDEDGKNMHRTDGEQAVDLTMQDECLREWWQRCSET